MATLGATAPNNGLTGRGGHTRAKAVLLGGASIMGLVRSLWHRFSCLSLIFEALGLRNLGAQAPKLSPRMKFTLRAGNFNAPRGPGSRAMFEAG